MKNYQYRNRISRTPALSSISAAVLATLIAGGAQAADTSYSFDGAAANANGHLTQNLPLNNIGAVRASLLNGVGSINASGSQNGSATFLTGNTMGASAIGNLAQPVNTSIDLSLINDSGGGNQGLASLLHSTNIGIISSLVENNGLSIALTGFETGSAGNKDNTISARTVVNEGVSSIAGSVPNGYASTTPGSTSISSFMGPTESAAQGSIVVTTAQQASIATSTATAQANGVTLALSADTLSAVESGAALTGNRIMASIKANSSANTIDIQAAGGAPAFAGSAVVSNTQLGLNASALAINTFGNVSATVSGVNGVSQLGGSLAVSGNSISSTATGNEALGTGLSPVGNRILLADGLAFAGFSGGIAGAILSGYASGTQITADLLIANTQSNQGTASQPALVSSRTSNGTILATVESLANGAINLSANSITSAATGNAASSALASGTGAASFNGSVALANQQDNSNSGVTALNIGSTIRATVGSVNDNRPTAGDVQDSSVSVAGNRSSASARGNEAGQSLSLNATTLALGDIANLNSQSNLLEASAAATVSNRQLSTGAPVTATNVLSSIGQFAGAVTGPTLSVHGNTQEAVALANNASNQLTLTGTTVGSSAGILSVQRIDPEDTNPSSPISATLQDARAYLEAGKPASGVTGSTLALTDNLQEAIGYGNLANNAMVVTGTTLAAPVTLGSASTVIIDLNAFKALSANVVAAYGVLNDQAVLSDVSARATSFNASSSILVTGPLGNSAVLQNGNTLAAEAYGNFGHSGLTLNAANLSGADFSAVANLTSLQAVDAAITAQAATGAVALTTINGAVGSDEGANDTISSVSASGNRIDAQASGSRIANAVNVNATNIATVAAAPLGASTGAGGLTANASFSLQNMQSGQGSVTATLRDADNASLPSDVRIAISGDVTRSSVVADGNTARASSTSNNASNALAIDALGSLASSSALQSGQITSARVNALIGQEGTPGIPAVAAGTYTTAATATAVPAADVTYNPVNGHFQVASGKTVTFSTAGAGADKAALERYLTSLGFTVDAAAGTASVTGTTVNLSSMTNVNQANSGGNSTYSFSGFTTNGVAAIDATPNLGGVNLAVSGEVTRSALSVSRNTTYGLARGNAATNLTSVKGNAIFAGSNANVATAGEGFGGGLETVADHTLSNLQQVIGGNPIDSNVYGTFAIDTQRGWPISRSSLSVSGNTQMAEARANIAGNRLALEGTGVTAVSALQSLQTSEAAVNASSNLNLVAPGAVTDSSVLLSNNSNIALAVINDATNSLSVKGSQVGTGQDGSSSVGAFFGDSLAAEHVLANQQIATSNVSSTANTRLNNQDAFAMATGSAIRSTLSIQDNTTAAEATANQAVNTASATGTASQAASVALRNIQESGANVTATATSAARIALAPLAQTALNASSVLIDGNSTTALARGNTASNVLNSLAGSAYGAASVGSVQFGDPFTGLAVNANAGISNRQNNTGAVLATSTGVSYQVALNSGGTAATASSLGVVGNQVAAQAYGNSAVNQLTLNALNTGTPTAAVGSYQSNSGAVTAAVNGVTFGAGITGMLTGSTVRANGNQITATAVGNSVVSSILAAAR